MPAIASLEDLKSARKPLRYALPVRRSRANCVGGCALPYALGKWRRIGWKNVCKLWLQERTPEELKGERD